MQLSVLDTRVQPSGKILNIHSGNENVNQLFSEGRFLKQCGFIKHNGWFSKNMYSVRTSLIRIRFNKVTAAGCSKEHVPGRNDTVCRRCAADGLLQAVCCRRCAADGMLQAVCCRRCAAGGLLQTVCCSCTAICDPHFAADVSNKAKSLQTTFDVNLSHINKLNFKPQWFLNNKAEFLPFQSLRWIFFHILKLLLILKPLQDLMPFDLEHQVKGHQVLWPDALESSALSVGQFNDKQKLLSGLPRNAHQPLTSHVKTSSTKVLHQQCPNVLVWGPKHFFKHSWFRWIYVLFGL